MSKFWLKHSWEFTLLMLGTRCCSTCHASCMPKDFAINAWSAFIYQFATGHGSCWLFGKYVRCRRAPTGIEGRIPSRGHRIIEYSSSHTSTFHACTIFKTTYVLNSRRSSIDPKCVHACMMYIVRERFMNSFKCWQFQTFGASNNSQDAPTWEDLHEVCKTSKENYYWLNRLILFHCKNIALINQLILAR